MATRKINLIPSELSVPAKTVVLAKVLNKISVVFSVLTLFLIIAAISLVTYYSIEYKRLNQSIDSLKIKIVNLSSSEQKLILAKDRIAKISDIKKKSNADTSLENFKVLYQNVQGYQDATLSEVKLKPESSEVSILIKSGQSLYSLLNFIKQSSGFENALLSSVGYNPSSGYLLDVIFK